MIGRTAECEALRDVLASARSGFSATLVLRGEAGIGKTALLEYVIEQAQGFRVLRVTGIESEMELGFAALYQLIQSFLPDIPLLPGPQRAALESAFGLAAGPAPDRFLVALATMTLLSGSAGSDSARSVDEIPRERPAEGDALLVAVDDAQWLDQASAEVLAFIARRLYADRIALVFTVREATGNQAQFDGLDSLRVRALSVADARELIMSLTEGHVAPGVADQIAARTEGSPLALVETARELTGEQLAGTVLLPEHLPLGEDAQERYWRNIALLPPERREFLLLAAAETSGDPELFERAAILLGLDLRLALTKEISELLTVTDRVSFRHPLIRSAVYRGSPERDRRRMHAAIAAVSDPDRDTDRIAWHRAAAAAGPDEEIAALLENAAGRVRRRGGYAGAAAFLRRAAELSRDAEHQGERLLSAARAEYTAGRVAQATELLDRGEPGLRDPRRRAQALQLRGEIQMTIGDGRRAPSTLLRAAQAWAPLDPEASRNALLDAMLAQVYAGGHEWTGTYAGIRAAYPGDGIARSAALDLMLDGFSALLTQGPAQGVPFLRQALRVITEDDLSDGQRRRWYLGGVYCAVDLLDLDAWQQMSDRCAALCRSRGDLTMLPLALDYLGICNTFAGRLSEAEAANAEAREILEATGMPDRMPVRLSEVLILAWRGQEAALREVAAEISDDCARRGQRNGMLYVELAHTIAGSGTRDYPSVLRSARLLFDARVPGVCGMILQYALEAAVHCGERETAELVLTWIRVRAEVSRTDWGLGLLAQGRALTVRSTGPDGDAEREGLFTEALDHLQRAGALADLARTRLLFGEWLRRRRRRGQAREHLRAAWESFTGIGAVAFADRARLELAAAGAKDFTDSSRTGAGQSAEATLTEREAQITRLVVAGATNAGVAAQLFISPSTVDYHLRHVYRKFDVRSRTQLAAVLRDQL